MSTCPRRTVLDAVVYGIAAVCVLFAMYLIVYVSVFRPIMVQQQVRAQLWGEWDDCAPHGQADYRCTWKDI